MIIFEQRLGVTDFQLLLLTNLRLRKAPCQQKALCFRFLANKKFERSALYVETKTDPFRIGLDSSGKDRGKETLYTWKVEGKVLPTVMSSTLIVAVCTAYVQVEAVS